MDSVLRITAGMMWMLILMLLSCLWPVPQVLAAPEKKAVVPSQQKEKSPSPAAASREPEPTLFKGATFLFPKGAQISSRWVLPPSDMTRLSASLSVDSSGSPVIGYEGQNWKYLMNPGKEYIVAVDEKLSAFTHLADGTLLLAAGNDIGLPAPLKEKTSDGKGVPVIAFQPLAALPLKKIEVLTGAGTTAYCAGFNPRIGRFAVFLLRTVQGGGFQDLEMVYESPDAVTAVTGTDKETYVACGRTVVRVSRTDGTVIPLYVHPSATVTALALTPAGLVVGTETELILTGTNGALEVMRSAGHRIAMRGDTLYVLFTKSLGVLALDNLAGLGRFNLNVRPAAAGDRVAPLSITGVRFFEGSGPPPYTQHNFADSFNRDAVRRIVARIDYRNPAGVKKTGKHMITVAWYEPTGGRLLAVSYPVVLKQVQGQLFASIGEETDGGYTPPPRGVGGATWKFGNDRLGLRYPGRYRVTVHVDGIAAAESFFSFAGQAKLGEVFAYDDVAVLESRLREGVSARHKNEEGTPLLNMAVQWGSTRTVELLLRRGADPNDTDSDGMPSLAVATGMFPEIADWRAKAELLVRHGANVNAFVGKDKKPLIYHNTWNPDRVIFLIENGADVNARNSSKDTLLGEAVSGIGRKLCRNDVISLLTQKGANLNEILQGGIAGSEKFTPLGYAIFSGDYDCVSVLLEKGASLSIAQRENNRPERSSLFVALESLARRTDKEPINKEAARRIVRLLIENGASLRPGKKISTSAYFGTGDYSSLYSDIRGGEGRIMFQGEGPSFFDRTELVRVLQQDDGALEKASGSKDPAIQDLALRSHLARVRELTAAARDEFSLKFAMDHCREAFKLAEPRYKPMQLDVVPDIQSSGQGPQAKPFLGAALLKREEGGAYVQRLLPGGAAERAGVRVGDIILALDTRRMKDAAEIVSSVSQLTPGIPVRITFLRDDPMQLPELPLTCGLLEKEIGEKGPAEMNLARWFAANPEAPNAGEIGAFARELSGGKR